MSTDDERLARATLSFVAEPGDLYVGRLVARLGALGALEVVRNADPPADLTEDAKQRTGLATAVERWKVRFPAADPDKLLTDIDKLGGRFICPGDPEWPSQLDDLKIKQPYGLWLLGPEDLRFSCLRSVAVVGARAASSYGRQVAGELAVELGQRGWTVVSGGAYGIDASAHRGALYAQGTTIGVFANGLDVTYPAEHAGLFAEMAQTCLLVTESPPGTTPTRPRFLVRNRIIAALTRGTVVVEAEARSGALSTAGHARDLGRAVMAVPGPVTSRMSVGCHTLLRKCDEARCVTDALEVLEEVGRIGDDLAPDRRGPVLPRDDLDPVTRDVLEAMPGRGGAGPAQLAVAAGLDMDTTLSRLGRLAAGGFIERCDEGWRLKRRKDDRR